VQFLFIFFMIQRFFGNKLTVNEQYTFKLHIVYNFLEGILSGLLLLNEFVFLKSMHASNMSLAFLFQLSVLLLLFSVPINEAVKRIKNKRKMMFYTGLITRLPLVFLLFFPRNFIESEHLLYYHAIFLFMFFMYYMANNIIYPIINLLLKTNYSHENFGKYYSYATMVKKTVEIFAAFLFGFWLDINPFSFTWVYAGMAILGILSIYILSKIPLNENDFEIPNKSYWVLMRESVQNMSVILRENRPYWKFETAFMLYGIAFNAASSVIVIFLDKALGLSFSGLAFYKNFYNVVAIMLLPIVGKFIGKVDVRKFSAITFASFFFYLFFIALSEYFPHSFVFLKTTMHSSLLLAFLSFGVFTATMALLWSVGSAYYCKAHEAADYQAIHLTLTGVRTSFSPIVGIVVLEYFGYNGVFVMCLAFAASAVFIMLLGRK